MLYTEEIFNELKTRVMKGLKKDRHFGGKDNMSITRHIFIWDVLNRQSRLLEIFLSIVTIGMIKSKIFGMH